MEPQYLESEARENRARRLSIRRPVAEAVFWKMLHSTLVAGSCSPQHAAKQRERSTLKDLAAEMRTYR